MFQENLDLVTFINAQWSVWQVTLFTDKQTHLLSLTLIHKK